MGAEVVEGQPDRGGLEGDVDGSRSWVIVRGRKRTPMSSETMASARVQPVVAVTMAATERR